MIKKIFQNPFCAHFLGKLSINLDFLLLWIVLMISNAHYLSRAFFPIHDTLEVFTFFHYFYCEWFVRGEIPQWFPQVTYGVPTNFYQLRNITPIYYVFMLLGKLFGIKDVIFLFKIAVLGEQSIFLLGMYVLSRYLFKHRATVILVSLIAIAGIVWHSAINFNFRLYAFFPLVTYLLLLFFEKKKEGYLWLAGITCLAGGMGVTIYFLGLWAWVYSTFAILLFALNRNAFKHIFQLSKKNILYFCIFIGLIAGTLIYIKTSINFLTLVSIDRKNTGVTTLETFLQYGRLPQVKDILKALFISNSDIRVGVTYDNTVYMGLVPLIFLVWSVMFVRDKRYYVFLSLAVMLVWFSFGGFFAALIYRFPAVSYYRHIGHVYSLVKVILIICLGYGIDHFWDASWKKKIGGTAVSVVVLLFLFDVFVRNREIPFSLTHLIQGIAGIWGVIRAQFFARIFQGRLVFPVCGMIVLGVLIGVKAFGQDRHPFSRIVLRACLFMILFMDLFIFQQRVNDTIPKIPQEHYSWLKSAEVRVADYQAIRTLEPFKPEHQDAYALVMLSNPTGKYVSAYNFVQFDRCDPGFRVDLASQGVLDLVSIPHLSRAVVGCYYPKMRLVPGALYSDDLMDLALIGKDEEAFRRIVVLPSKNEGQREYEGGTIPTHPGNRVEVKSFSPNRVAAEVYIEDEKGSWLVYADAYNPRWEAFIDGTKTGIHKAYLAFKAVFVQKGKHAVVFSLAPVLKVRSAIVALIGLSFGLILSGFFIRELFLRNRC